MLAPFLFLATFLIIALRLRPAEERFRIDTPGICYTCKYDLSATPEPLPCPECGQTTREHYRMRRRQTRIILLPGRLLWPAAMLSLFFVYYPAAIGSAHYFFFLSYPGASQSIHFALAERAYSSVFWPVEVAIGLTPALALIPQRWRLPMLAALLASSIVFTAARWYLGYRF